MEFDDQTILLIEDNEGDVYLFKRVVSKAGIKNPVQVVRTGEQAVGYLAGTGKYEDRQQYPLPFLVMLDLKLPLKDGLDVLQWMRERPDLASTKVIVLTSSSEPRDVERANQLGALSYLVKPPNQDALVQILERLRGNGSNGDPHSKTSALQISGCLFDDMRKGKI
jgi:CheY-like chemotaxis protein